MKRLFKVKKNYNPKKLNYNLKVKVSDTTMFNYCTNAGNKKQKKVSLETF